MSEISPENLTALDNRYQATMTIYLTQIGLAVVLVLIGFFSPLNLEGSIPENALMPLRVGVIFIAIASIVVRRLLLRWDRLQTVALLKGVRGLLSSLQSNAIILGVMAEIVAVLGFLIAAVSGVRAEILTFGGAALILFFLNFPRKPIWEKIVAKLENV
ncbi:MAG: hypothetical protein R2747_06710 [Pyrinomonadaceae bacterium]